MCRGLVMRTPQTEKVEWLPLRCRRPPSIALPAVSLVMPFQNSALAPRLCLHTNELFNDLCWCEMQVGDAIEWALRLGDIPKGYRLRGKMLLITKYKTKNQSSLPKAARLVRGLRPRQWPFPRALVLGQAVAPALWIRARVDARMCT